MTKEDSVEKADVSEQETPDENEETPDEVEDGDSEDSEDDSSSTEDDVDYDEEIEAEQKRAPDPKKAFERIKGKEKKRETSPEGTPLTEERLQEILAEERRQARLEAQEERITEIVSGMTANEKEARLTMQIHKNRMYPENMPLREQLEEAFFVANRKKVLAKNSELARALKGKNNSSRDVATTHRDQPEGVTPKVKEDLKLSLKRAGFNYDPKTKVYVKKLPNGKLLIKRTPTDRPEIQKA